MEAELKELGDDLEKTLFYITENAIDVHHACLLMMEAGIINLNVLRNYSVLRDFDIMYKNPLEKQMSIYYSLSVKYDLSVPHVRKIISDYRKK